MTKEEIINKIVEDLPTRDMRGEMSKDEWCEWFKEVFDEGVKYKKERKKLLIDFCQSMECHQINSDQINLEEGIDKYLKSI